MEREKKEARIYIKIEQSIKDAAMEAAVQGRRSLSNYLVNLISQDCKKRKIIE